jgi:hypothetical protein
MESIGGLPAHPLFVHLPVVLIPLAFVGAIVLLAVAKWRRAAWVIAALAAIGMLGALMAENSGEALEESAGESQLVEEHAEQGELVPILAGIFFLSTGALAGYELVGRRKLEQSSADGSTGSPSRTPKLVGTALAAAAVLTGGIATYSAVAAGHSGAKAVWHEELSGEGGDRSEADERDGSSREGSSDSGYDDDDDDEG